MPRPTLIDYERPWLYREQEEFLFSPARYSICEASTKTGKTTGCLIWLVEQAVLNGGPGREFWWVAPIYRQAEIAFTRAKIAIPSDFYSVNEQKRTVTLVNGSVIRFLSAEKPDNLYGDDVWAVVLDEASRMREAAFNAIRSVTTVTRAPMRIIGNVKGRKNWMFKLARRAQGGEQGFFYKKLTAYHAAAAGLIAPEEIEDARRVLPEHVFKELYLAEASDLSTNPFGSAHIDACTQAEMAGGPVVIWGIDLARVFDWTVLVGLNKHGLTAAYHRFQKPWAETLAFIRRTVGETPGVIDATGVGDPVTELLGRDPSFVEGEAPLDLSQLTPLEAARAQKEGLDKLTTEAMQVCPSLFPYKFTGPSKQHLLEAYAAAVQAEEIGIYAGNNEEVTEEHDAFEFEYTRTGVRYSAPEGMHDDTVVAYALANLGRRTALLQASMGGATVAM